MSSDEETKKRKFDDAEDEDAGEKSGDLSEKDGKETNEPEQDGDKKTKRKRVRKRKKKSKSAASEKNEKDTTSHEVKCQSLDYTIYVEGLPFECSEDEVKDFFVQNGCTDVIQMRLARWQDTGRLRGFGHIVFDTTDSRNKAISDLNGMNLNRRYLNIKEPNSVSTQSNTVARSQPEGCKTIFARNLPYDTTEEEMHETFRSCGKIVDGGVRMVRRNNNLFKGFAYIEYKNPEGAYAAYQRAMKPEGIVMKGRRCVIDYDEGAVKGSYRNSDGRLWHKQHGSSHRNSGTTRGR